LFLAGVPKRGGVLSQWHSFLFYNAKVRQKRSRAERHELDYNVELLCHVLNIPIPEHVPNLRLQASEKENMVEKFGLQPNQFCVVHPGMGGSALNWPSEYYVNLIKYLSQKHRVV